MEKDVFEIIELEIKFMNNFIKAYGYDAFRSAVYYGAFANVAYDYLHPEDETKSTDNFEPIQQAFINAYA